MTTFYLMLSMMLAPIDPPADTLVICPREFQPSLKPWVDYRTKQGHSIKIADPKDSAFGIGQLIKKESLSKRLENVVLIGDCRIDADRKNRGNTVPTDYIKAKINVKYGAVADIATDNKYADLDGDGSPDLTIGRIPVDTAGQLDIIVKKIIDYEQRLTHGLWQRKINLVAGVGGFGVVEDRVVETTTKKLITDIIPSAFDVSVTFASWSSPFCPDPRKFSATAIERLNEGAMFWVYVGHGHYNQLDRVNVAYKQYRIFDVSQMDQIKSRAGMPIAIFLACNTCGFDHASDCIGEELIKRPQGPVAVLGGSRVTMPYGMGVMSLELMQDFFAKKHETLGQLILAAKQRMVKDHQGKSEYREMVDVLGKAFSPNASELEQERNEHVHLMHLVGDPLLRISKPLPVKVLAASEAKAGSPLRVNFESPIDGQAKIEIVYRRDRLTFRPQRRTVNVFNNDELTRFQEVYEKANDRVKVDVDLSAKRGTNEVVIEIPADARGKCNVRVYVAGKDSHAMGSEPIQIKRSK